MSRWVVTNPWVFFGICSAVMSYLLFMMTHRRRKRENDIGDEELEL